MPINIYNNWNKIKKPTYNKSKSKNKNKYPKINVIKTQSETNVIKTQPETNVIKTQPEINNSGQFDIFFQKKLSEFKDKLNMPFPLQSRQKRHSETASPAQARESKQSEAFSRIQARQSTQPEPVSSPIQTDLSEKDLGEPNFDLAGSNQGEINFDQKSETDSTGNIFSENNPTIDGKYVDHKNPKNQQITATDKVEADSGELLFTKKGKKSLHGKKVRKDSYKLKDNTIVNYNEIDFSDKKNDKHLPFKKEKIEKKGKKIPKNIDKSSRKK